MKKLRSLLLLFVVFLPAVGFAGQLVQSQTGPNVQQAPVGSGGGTAAATASPFAINGSPVPATAAAGLGFLIGPGGTPTFTGTPASPYPTPTAAIFGTFAPIPFATATPNPGTPLIVNNTNISGQIDEEGTVNNAGTVTCGTTSNHVWTTCHFTIANGAAFTLANPTNLPTNAVVWISATQAGATIGSITFGTNFLAYLYTSGGFSGMNGAASYGALFSSGVTGDTEAVPFWSDGTNLKMIAPRSVTVPNLWAFNLGLSGDAGTQSQSMARIPLSFTEGNQSSLVANSSMGTFLTTRAITIENIILDIGISPTCSVSEQIACFDCGNAAGACTAGRTSTIMNAVTIASGATRQSISETVNTASVAAGEYISCLITAGTCTASSNTINMMARPQ